MNDKIEAFQTRIRELEAKGQLSEEAAELLRDMYGELESVIRQNRNLRRTALKAVSKDSRMSSKLKDALME